MAFSLITLNFWRTPLDLSRTPGWEPRFYVIEFKTYEFIFNFNFLSSFELNLCIFDFSKDPQISDAPEILLRNAIKTKNLKTGKIKIILSQIL